MDSSLSHDIHRHIPAYTDLKPTGYLPRLADALVDDALANFGGIEICGGKWTGKSWTSSAFGNSITRIDDAPDLYKDDSSLALIGSSPHVIDEWQDAPQIWNAVRHRIDDRANEPGQFILTGSSTPPHTETRHSGAGRIARIRMQTMTLTEMGISSKKISLSDLFEGRFEPCQDSIGLLELAHIICRGGWPALQSGARTNPARVIADYLDALFEISMVKAGKSPVLSRKIAQSLARTVATAAKLATIALDSNQNNSIATEQTVSEYLDEFSRNYFIQELPGWDAPIRSKSRLRTKAKRYFDDPSLAASLLHVNEQRLLRDAQIFGLLFESLCVHDLSVYASLLPHAGSRPLYYYSDADGLEVDVIIEQNDGTWAGIEIKLGESKLKEAVANLKRLRAKVALNPAAQNPKPAFMAVLLGKGSYARYLKEDDIYVIPVGSLGP